MSFEGLEPVDASVGDWIAPRLAGSFGAVGLTVPTGFDAYVRVFHPARGGGRLVRWEAVCTRQRRVSHALMQWHRVSVDGSGREWPGPAPDLGNAPPNVLQSLLSVLAPSSAGTVSCMHALWEGWGWDQPESYTGSLLRLPGRD